MTIRAFTPQDFSAVAAIYHHSKLDELRFETQTFELLPLVEDKKRHSELMESDIYLYENHQGILGYLALFEQANKYEIRALFVHPKSRGQGIGKKLFEFAIQNSRPPISLYVAQSNTPAKSLYQAYGFTTTEEFLTEYNGVAVMANKMQLHQISPT